MKQLATWIPVAALPLSCLLLGIAPFTCSPLSQDWGFEAIAQMQTPPDPPLVCDLVLPQTPGPGGCQFGQGSHTSESLGFPAALAAQLPIRHVIILVKENRSFDHLFGQLYKLYSPGEPAPEAVPPTYSNPDSNGVAVVPFHATTTCLPEDPGHQAAAVVEQISDGDMTGFVKNAAQTTGTDGHFVMSYYDQPDLPFNYWLASTYAVGDRHFASSASGTYDVRDYLMFGTNGGVVDTGVAYPDPKTPSIFRTLMDAGYTWGAYSDSEPLSGTLGWSASDPGVHSYADFLSALDQGTLPNVAFVDAVESYTDDHPLADLQVGEAWTREVYQHASASPQWSRLAILWVYDEAGGFADHVPPPEACLATPSRSTDTRLGPRVPLVAISRWAKPHYVSHVVRDHTAITRFIELLFDLPALTARDANSDALLDLFDFSCSQPEHPLEAPPAAGSGLCPDPSPPGAT